MPQAARAATLRAQPATPSSAKLASTIAELRCTPEFVADLMARFNALPDADKAAMWKAQRESFRRAFEPCEHGDYDWETCPDCLALFATKTGEQ